MSLFRCPICAAPLTREGRTYTCPNRHCYDVAKEGYVHLLPANQKHSANPGDDKAMIAARTAFLDGGCYAPLREAVCGAVSAHGGQNPKILDVGCGEGYYTQGLSQMPGAEIAGVDLSKAGLKRAARRVKEGEFAVPGGLFVYVVPAPMHLMEMKAVLYDTPYPNPEERVEYEGFSYVDIIPVTTTFTLPNPDTIQALFGMTPYAWKTPKAGVERLKELEQLTVTADFRVHVFRREGCTKPSFVL